MGREGLTLTATAGQAKAFSQRSGERLRAGWIPSLSRDA